MVFLSMFGADGRGADVRRGCDYVLVHLRAPIPLRPLQRADGTVSDGDGASLCGKMGQDVEQNGQPSKWVTLRVLRVPKRAA